MPPQSALAKALHVATITPHCEKSGQQNEKHEFYRSREYGSKQEGKKVGVSQYLREGRHGCDHANDRARDEEFHGKDWGQDNT